MPSHQKRRKSQRRRQRGGDASAWAGAVYGPAGAHTAGTGNVIATNNLSGINMCSGGVAANASPILGGSAASPIAVVPGPSSATTTLHTVKGGRRKHNGGKGLLVDLAVPAVLLYANQAIKSRKTIGKRSKKNFSRKFRKH